jgi:hypothetical protein
MSQSDWCINLILYFYVLLNFTFRTFANAYWDAGKKIIQQEFVTIYLVFEPFKCNFVSRNENFRVLAVRKNLERSISWLKQTKQSGPVESVWLVCVSQLIDRTKLFRAVDTCTLKVPAQSSFVSWNPVKGLRFVIVFILSGKINGICDMPKIVLDVASWSDRTFL